MKSRYSYDTEYNEEDYNKIYDKLLEEEKNELRSDKIKTLKNKIKKNEGIPTTKQLTK
jgi:hypothetical protein